MARRPATFLLSVILCALYLTAAQIQAHGGVGPLRLLPETLVAFGALVTPAAWPDDLWRLLAAPLLHVDLQHLLVNVGLVLFFCGGPGRLPGPGLELAMGGFRLLLVFALGGLLGSLLGVVWYRHTSTICVGASGAVLALLATGFFVGGFSLRGKLLALLWAAGLLIFGALYQGDNAAHLGGLFAGTLAGLWQRTNLRRRTK